MEELHTQVEQLKNTSDPSRPARKARAALDPAEVAQSLEDLVNEYDSDEGVEPETTDEFLNFEDPDAGALRVLRQQREQVIAKEVTKAERTGAYSSAVAQHLTVEEHERVLGALRAYHARRLAPAPPTVSEDDESTMEYRAGHESMPFVSSRSGASADPFANVTRRKRK